MAELVDAPDLGSGIERCEGSSPFTRTTDHHKTPFERSEDCSVFSDALSTKTSPMTAYCGLYACHRARFLLRALKSEWCRGQPPSVETNQWDCSGDCDALSIKNHTSPHPMSSLKMGEIGLIRKRLRPSSWPSSSPRRR